ncbi:MAG: hypothetical protein Q9220_000677 [cf. Caloplaca sp. 1 TL-2023]
MLLSLGWTVLVCWLDGRVPVRLIWLSSLFVFIGGGQRVAKAMLFTIVSDAVDASYRTRYMSFLSSIPHITTLIAPPLSALFMRLTIWLPFEVAIGSLILTYLLIFFMPESSKIVSPDDNDDDDDDDTTGLDTTISSPPPTPKNHQARPLLSTTSSSDLIPPSSTKPSLSSTSWSTEIAHLLSLPTLRFTFLISFVAPIAFLAKAFVYQHASESFHWPFRTTTWLRVSQAIGASLVTLIALPLLNHSLLKSRHRHHGHNSSDADRSIISSQALDLLILRLSLLIGAIGFLLLYLATQNWLLVLALFVCGLSEAIQPATQGLATSVISREYNARLFTTVAVLETVGKLAGGPVQGYLFSLGRGEGRGSKGWNFAASSAIFGMLLVVAVVVRVRGKK